MLKRKALKKILITTVTVFILLTIYWIPTRVNQKNKLSPDISVEYTRADYSNIYLLNLTEQLVRTNVLIKRDKELDLRIKEAIEMLIVSNNDLIPSGLNSIIPKNTKIKAIKVDENIVYINFSKEILNIDKNLEEKMIEAISYTIFEFNNINGIAIYVGEDNISELLSSNIPEMITKDFGINKKYDIRSFNEIQRVVVYYVDEIAESKYYVPITKYINDDRDKIKIIVEELSSSYIYEPNLISYLNKTTELINYEIDSETMTLNFNNSIFMGEDKILEEVIYTISYSVFDNYDVKEVIFQVEDKDFVKKVTKNIE